MAASMKNVICCWRNLDFISRSKPNFRILMKYSTTFADLELQTKQLDVKMSDQVKTGKVKHHPGRCQIKRVQVPERLQKATEILREKYPTGLSKEKTEKFARFLTARKPPTDTNDLRMLALKTEQEILKEEKINPTDLNDELENQVFVNKVKNKVVSRLKKQIYHWKPMDYTANKGFLYLAARLAPEYAVLTRIFNEIARRDPEFKPISLFDFGSGIGTTTWAANRIWGKRLAEYYCVDASGDMNTLARLLTQDGEEQKDPCFQGVFYRQFVPSDKNKYSITVSAYSLLEMPNKEARVKMVRSLWEKTDKYLVIAEHGSNVGYHLMLEARDYILQTIEETNSEGHVFAPCSHDLSCPRLNQGTNIPCNYQVDYLPLDAPENVKQAEKFCYLIFKRGSRNEETSWPRIVKPIQKPSRHVHCRLCTASGKLAHLILTSKKNGKDMYQCARNSQWGDLLPAQVVPSGDKTQMKEQSEVVDTQDSVKIEDVNDERTSGNIHMNGDSSPVLT